MRREGEIANFIPHPITYTHIYTHTLTHSYTHTHTHPPPSPPHTHTLHLTQSPPPTHTHTHIHTHTALPSFLELLGLFSTVSACEYSLPTEDLPLFVSNITTKTIKSDEKNKRSGGKIKLEQNKEEEEC